jgi:hypothetical protein
MSGTHVNERLVDHFVSTINEQKAKIAQLKKDKKEMREKFEEMQMESDIENKFENVATTTIAMVKIEQLQETISNLFAASELISMLSSLYAKQVANGRLIRVNKHGAVIVTLGTHNGNDYGVSINMKPEVVNDHKYRTKLFYAGNPFWDASIGYADGQPKYSDCYDQLVAELLMLGAGFETKLQANANYFDEVKSAPARDATTEKSPIAQ